MSYCPKCKSRLYAGDSEYIEVTGVCSFCVCYDTTPDKRFQNKMDEYRKSKKVTQGFHGINGFIPCK